MRDTVGDVKTNSYAMFSHGPLHTDEQVLNNQLVFIYNSSVRTQYVIWRTYQKRSTIETNGQRESGKSVLVVRLDDDDDDDFHCKYIIFKTLSAESIDYADCISAEG